MGGENVFRQALIRRPLKKWKKYKRAGGPYSGISPQNVPWEIYVICSPGEGINVNTYLQLNTVISMEGLLDLLEMHECQASEKDAAMLNIEWKGSLPTAVR